MKVFIKTVTCCVVTMLVAAVMLALFYYYYRDNFHAILPGRYYRSAQLDAADLVRVIAQKHLKSVIDLRIKDRDINAYQMEKRIAKNYGLKFYYSPMYAYQLPKASELQKLTSLLLSVPQPVLIHCAGGADRSGLAAAIVLLLHDYSLKRAQDQISLRYFVISSNSVGKLVLPYYASWLKKNSFVSSRQHYLEWVGRLSLAKRREQ